MAVVKRRPGLPFRPSMRHLVTVLILLGLVAYRVFSRQPSAESFTFDSSRKYRVERVVDGDTLLLENGTRVRLIGVNTPETKHPDKPVEPLGPEAAEFTRQHVEGREVTLQFDRERHDRFQRVLAYVYLEDWFLNEELIRQGFSKAETRFPYRNSMKKRFRKAESEAREQGRGIWAK